MQEQSKNTVKKPLLIELQYLGPVHYYARLLHHKKIVLEKQEYYQKATYRNRSIIAMPHGPLTLSVHLKDGRDQRKPVTQVRICDTHNWRSNHWRSLCAAYRSSPYFEYYEDDLAPLFEQEFQYLWDCNWQFFQKTLELLKVELEVSSTDKFEKDHGEDLVDMRSAILPNGKSKPDSLFEAPAYDQVFEPKIGFFPNLSILDLLFAVGPNAADLLRSSMKKPA